MRRVAAAVCAALVFAACGGGQGDRDTAEGVVIDVVGGLTHVDTFSIRTGGGEDLTFVAGSAVGFHGDGPLGHLRSHLATGEPVLVTYEVLADGSLQAVEVDDAGG